MKHLKQLTIILSVIFVILVLTGCQQKLEEPEEKIAENKVAEQAEQQEVNAIEETELANLIETYSKASSREETEEILEELTINLYFSDNKAISETDCSQTLATERKMPYTQDIEKKALFALNELLKGPTEQEKETMSLSVPEGAKFLSLRIEENLAIVNFSKELLNFAGGNCIIIATRAQIENTLTQFAEIDNVHISIEQGFEEVLKP